MEFLAYNSIYIVLAIVLICWFGIFGYLVVLEKKIKNLEEKINS
jgi:CcmD family protein